MKVSILLLFWALTLTSASHKLFDDCLSCHLEVKLAREGNNQVKTYFLKAEHIVDKQIEKLLEAIAMKVCTMKQMEEADICKGAISEMTPTILESLVYKYMDSDFVCPLLQRCKQVYYPLSAEEYIQDVIKDKPTDSEWPQLKEGGEIVRIVHISDLHIDLFYKEGSNSKCGQPVCCREGLAENSELAAGYWGSLATCDLPERTIQQLINFIQNDVHKPNEKLILLWTGDNAPHDIWKQSKEYNLQYSQKIVAYMKQTFDKDIIVIPVVGNHEAYPVNVFDFKSQREKGFLEAYGEMWKDWIGNEASQSVKENGFYKIELEDYNLKIIAFDSQVCNPDNWYLIKDPTDPAGFLDWARNQLAESEKKQQAVYFISHIYTSSCLSEWGMRFKALIDRYSRIVRAQINGHAHGEFYNLYRGYSKNETLSVAFISSSVTTYSNRNPSFRVFEVDKETMIPKNYFQYRLNLTKANVDGPDHPLKWENVFNFLEEYKVKSLHPKDIDEMTERVLTDNDLAYKIRFNQQSGNMPKQLTGNNRSLYCKLKSSLSEESDMCLDGSIHKGLEQQFVELAQGPWKEKRK